MAPRAVVRVAIVAGVLAAGLALRLWILSSHLGEVDQDEAVVGLMARHVLDGELSVFFWGQAYGGAQEAVLTAGLFALFGSGATTLKLVPLVLYGLATVLVWRVGRRAVGEPAAAVGALVFWLGPAFFVLRSTRAYGFYGTAMVVSLALLLVVLRLQERDSAAESAALGLLLGVGWWTTPQIVFVAVPALAWLLPGSRHLLRRLPVVALGAVVGAAPWLVWNLRHQWMSLDTDIFAGIGDNSYADHLEGFFNPLLPMALGLQVPYSRDWLLWRPLALAAYALLLLGFTVLALRRRRGDLLVVVAVAYPFLYALSPAAFYLFEPRYLFLLSPVLALLFARALGGPLRRVVGVAAVTALCVAALRQLNLPDPVNAPPSLRPVISILDERRVDRLFAAYTVAHRLGFDTDERIAAAPIEYIRYPPLERRVRAAPVPAYLLVEGTPVQAQFEAGLDRLGLHAAMTAIGPFRLYQPSRPVLPEDWWVGPRGLAFVEKAAGVPRD